MLIDSHCHLHDAQFFSREEAEAALIQAKKAGVSKIICIGTSHNDSLVARDFAMSHTNVYWTYGIHPSEATNLSNSRACSPSRSSRRQNDPPVKTGGRVGSRVDKLVAIGEVGLDYHYEGYDREKQIRLFEEMLQLAIDNNLPVSFHIREAFDDFFAVVANFPNLRGVVHSFSDNKKNLRRILNETDYYVGVNGMATYSTLPTPPLERILLETDAPFLSPVPHRHTTNEPAFIPDIAKWLSKKLELPFEEVARATTENATVLFGF